MLPWGPITLTLMLPDGSEITRLPYHEADTDVRHRDATTYLVPVQSTKRTRWPERVVGEPGVRVRRLGHPHESNPANVRWATAEELPGFWSLARQSIRLAVTGPVDESGIVVIEAEPDRA